MGRAVGRAGVWKHPSPSLHATSSSLVRALKSTPTNQLVGMHLMARRRSLASKLLLVSPIALMQSTRCPACNVQDRACTAYSLKQRTSSRHVTLFKPHTMPLKVHKVKLASAVSRVSLSARAPYRAIVSFVSGAAPVRVDFDDGCKVGALLPMWAS